MERGPEDPQIVVLHKEDDMVESLMVDDGKGQNGANLIQKKIKISNVK